MKRRIVVAMSGGVDSAVAASLLKEEGYEVIGVTLKLWPRIPSAPMEFRLSTCCTPETLEDARLVAAQLGIPHYLLSAEREFEERVITPFCQEYMAGRTPLPCAICNRDIKFGSLLKRAAAWGADCVATGHYARTVHDTATGRVLLKRGVDPEKDQTYFLATLTHGQLRRIRFPLGGMRKTEVRSLAASLGLRVACKPESQELCFLPTGDYRELLRERYGEGIRSGVIRDMHGRILGRHQGLAFYTVGQRRGLGIAGGGPYYVVALSPEENEVIVGREEDLFADAFVAERVNFLPFDELEGERSVLASIRYRHPPVEATLHPRGSGRVLVQFARPIRAITPGQGVIFYDPKDPDLVVGGGTIGQVIRDSPPKAQPLPASEPRSGWWSRS